MACKKCGECCRWILVSMEAIGWDIRWLQGRQGIVSGEYGLIPCKCEYLQDNNECSIYETRPTFCRKFPVRDEEGLAAIGCGYWEDHGQEEKTDEGKDL